MTDKTPRKSPSPSARLNPRHQDMVRAKIQASQIIRRFFECHMGRLELTKMQFETGKVLLAKSVPDLSHAVLSNPDGTTLNFTLLVPPKE